jgi:bacterioferritin-associated ferredoxin
VYVCLCNVVTEHTVEQAIAAGATTPEQVGRACDAGTACGGCHEIIEQLLAQAQAKLEATYAG